MRTDWIYGSRGTARQACALCLSHIPANTGAADSVSLVAIKDVTAVNNLAPSQTLTFEQGHIYPYFRSKEEIFSEIRVDAVSRALERLTEIAPIAENDPE